MAERGVVAAGHPLTAEAGADVLRAGGNAVDAALAALMTSFVTEPLLTGLGAGGYMLVAAAGRRAGAARLLRRGAGRRDGRRARRWTPVDVDFGDAVQVFHIGAVLVRRLRRAGGRRARRPRASAAMPLAELRRARDRARPRAASSVNAQQALPVGHARADRRRHAGVARAAHARRARAARGRRRARPGARRRASSGSAPTAPAPFYTRRHRRRRSSDWVRERGGTLDARRPRGLRDDRRASRCASRYHGREVLTNPPPSAGGMLIAYALALLERAAGAAGAAATRRARWRPRRPSARRRSSTACDEPGFLERVHGLAARLDDARLACSTPTAGRARSRRTNGEGSGIVVPGTGIHVNNMMGEQDLSPAGWFTHPPGPPAAVDDGADVVLDDGAPELVLGSAGSNRIRSAILQVIVNAIDHGMDAQAAVDAPRLHFEDGARLRRAGHRRRDARGRRPRRSRGSASATSSSAAARPWSATTRPARFRRRRPPPRRRGGRGVIFATPRLDLVELDLAAHRALVEGTLRDIAGAAVPGDLAAGVPSAMRIEQLERDPGELPWLVRALVLRDERRVVGSAGFHAPPSQDGMAELGYQICAADRRRGFAREAVTGLMDWAAPRVRVFRASIAPDNLASRALVQVARIRAGRRADGSCRRARVGGRDPRKRARWCYW